MFFFSTITTLDQFTQKINAIDDVDGLNEIRDVVRKYQGNHPLRHEKYGFALVHKALDRRADTLGLMKYTFGYRKPLYTR